MICKLLVWNVPTKIKLIRELTFHYHPIHYKYWCKNY